MKCRRLISSEESLSFTHWRSEIVLFGSYFILALGFGFIFTVPSLNLSKSYKFDIQMWLIKSRATSWVTLRKGSKNWLFKFPTTPPIQFKFSTWGVSHQCQIPYYPAMEDNWMPEFALEDLNDTLSLNRLRSSWDRLSDCGIRFHSVL